MVNRAELRARLAELGRSVPKENRPDIGGARNAGAEEGMPVKKRKRAKK